MESSLRRAGGGIPWRALLLSLGLHALALGVLLPVAEPAARAVAPAAPLLAALRPAAPALDLPPVPPPAAPPAAPPRVFARATVAPAAAPPAPSLSVPMVAPAGPASATVESAGGIPAESAAPEPVTVALAPPVEMSGPDAAGLRQFRLALAGEARRLRRYPEAARREGRAGTVDIRVAVVRGARSAELAASSGDAALDAAALEMLRQAAARATLPEALRGRDFAVLLPVVFEVED